MNCEHCDAPNPQKGRFCRRCGKALADPLVRSTTRLSPLMEKWRRLNLQMTRKELRRQLGEPLLIEALRESGQTLEKWLFEYESVNGASQRVHGEVCLSSEGRVVAWREPDWREVQKTPEPVP